MLPPNATVDQWRSFLKVLARPAFESGCNACKEGEDLRLAWLADEKPLGERTAYLELYNHVKTCPVCQERIRLGKAELERQREKAITAGAASGEANPTQTTKGGTPSPGLETRRGVPAELAAERLVEV